MKRKISVIVLIAMCLQLLCCGIVLAEDVNIQTVKVDNDPTIIKTGQDPVWSIKDISVPDKILIGQNFEMVITVSNVGTGVGSYPYFHFTEGSGDDTKDLTHFAIISGDGNSGYDPMLKTIGSGESRVFHIVMQVKSDVKELPEGSDYQINCTIGSDNAKAVIENGNHDWANKMYRQTKSIHIKPVYALSSPVFVVDSITFDTPITEGVKEVTSTITLENISDSKANNVVVTLEGKEVGESGKKNLIVKDLTYSKRLYDVRGKQKVSVNYRLELNPDRQNNEMIMKIKYDGQETEQTEYLNMPLPSNDSSGGKTPKVIIEQYNLQPSKVLAGNYVTLQLYIQNTNTLPVKNISIKLDVPTETVSSGGSVSGSTVFSPVNSSNTFYIDRIEGKSTEVKEITMYVNPVATAKTYIVPVEISYENNVGEQCPNITDNVNIPVAQESKLDIIKSSIPMMGNVGEALNFTTEFVNVGKTTLTNLKVQVIANGSGAEDSTSYIGTFESGATDEYSGAVFPEEEGALEGEILFTYLDGDNQPAELSLPFSVEIGPAIEMPEIDPTAMEEPEESFADKLKGKILVIILCVIIVIQGVVLFRIKRKQKADEELMQ